MSNELCQEFNQRKEMFLQVLQVVKNYSIHTLRNYRMDLEQFKFFVDTFYQENIWMLAS